MAAACQRDGPECPLFNAEKKAGNPVSMLTDEANTGELPVVKARTGWGGEPQHTRPPGWPGSEAEFPPRDAHGRVDFSQLPPGTYVPVTQGVPELIEFLGQPVKQPHVCLVDVACAHPADQVVVHDPRLWRFTFNQGQPTSGPRHRARKGQS